MKKRAFSKDRLYMLIKKLGFIVSLIGIFVFFLTIYLMEFKVEEWYENRSNSCEYFKSLEPTELYIDVYTDCIVDASNLIDFWNNTLYISGFVGFGFPISYVLLRKLYNYLFPIA